MFKKVLVANRGEIACRIIKSLRKMGIQSVAIYSKADADARHVNEATEAWCIGEATASDSYLNSEKILQVALKSGAEAIHPGYGFLSENAEFASQCSKEGLVFIGPSPEQMISFGLKHEARKIAEFNDVPCMTSTPLLASINEAVKLASKIGYPVMLKSTGGGGGIGMQRCNDEESLRANYESVTRLAANNFKHSGIYLEKFISHAKHIEVQMFGDGRGHVAILGERECSLQRRNQKVVEETPSRFISQDLRRQLFTAAERLGKAVNYQSAGTVEFLVNCDTNDFYFLEVNTRLQVEHGVTELVTGLDLVEWMLRQAAGEDLGLENYQLKTNGHAIQARIYAEDPNRKYQPCPGTITEVHLSDQLRWDGWIEQGTEISAFYDPLLAKGLAWSPTRELAIDKMFHALSETRIGGIQTNIDLIKQVLCEKSFQDATYTTALLQTFQYQPCSIDVIEPGLYTLIQDYPGRVGYWDIGVPPSGPMDDLALRIANKLVGNMNVGASALEMTVVGPTLKFNSATRIALAGADMQAKLDGEPLKNWTAVSVKPGGVLSFGPSVGCGCRTYLAVAGGFDVPQYLGSQSTFALGQFGGLQGGPLTKGQVLPLTPNAHVTQTPSTSWDSIPQYTNRWQIGVLYGPHGAPDFFKDSDLEMFFATDWQVHYNSNRLGIRLIGPAPEWARADGGDAGLHPSNIHDCEYAIGSVNFSGDVPIILTLDGPSLGGFVCPVTVVQAEMWKLGQIKPMDTIRFIALSEEEARSKQRNIINSLQQTNEVALNLELATSTPVITKNVLNKNPAILLENQAQDTHPKVVIRRCGDRYALIEYGPNVLDLDLRFRVHGMMEAIRREKILGIRELSPGVRSLQIHYEPEQISTSKLISTLASLEAELPAPGDMEVETRTVHMPMLFQGSAVLDAIDRYQRSVRPQAPYLPDNIEFIRRINGLPSRTDVERIIYDASYFVLGLGDVYLGAPCAVPLDPRHRLVTSKYNPARTFTPEGVVGIGGVYMCIYGMNSPGGYQLIGRTVPIWNKFLRNSDFQKGEPWLLKFFDQIRFYPMEEKDLNEYRDDYRRGKVHLKIENGTFKLKDYHRFNTENAEDINTFLVRQKHAFAEERNLWNQEEKRPILGASREEKAEETFTHGSIIRSEIAGNIWEVCVKEGDTVVSGQKIAILETMKMEFEILSPIAGKVSRVLHSKGQAVSQNTPLFVIE